MKKYIITVPKRERDFNAASKARADAEVIARRTGYEPFLFTGESSARRNPLAAVSLLLSALRNWRRLEREAEEGSTVLMQYPHYPLKTAVLLRWWIPWIRKRKGIRFIFLIHDLNSLRGTFGKAAVYSDRHLLKEGDVVICHNARMKEVLMGWGVPGEKLISLEIFDYLTEVESLPHAREDGIAVAGNLDPEKCGYIGKLTREKENALPLHLYGKGFPEELQGEGVFCHGAFPAEELPGAVRGGFGLVWDGPETDGCREKMGEYMRWNNPHKLSLYLACGLPVILWKEAAEAAFVAGKGLGILTGSLKEAEEEIRMISKEKYEEMLHRTRETGEKLRTGTYLATALQKAETRD
ncbi:MAG: hypothetical protein IJ719_22870 [Clostridia bacterium]|nr:hypothetical protein [Clostridia bacterium]